MWWQIFHSPNCNEWTNLLILIQLLFALPASNGKIERVFPQLNVIKTKKRTALSNDTIDDLLVIKANLKIFNFGGKQKTRKQYAVHRKSTSTTTSISTVSLLDSESTISTGSDDDTDDDDILLDD